MVTIAVESHSPHAADISKSKSLASIILARKLEVNTVGIPKIILEIVAERRTFILLLLIASARGHNPLRSHSQPTASVPEHLPQSKIFILNRLGFDKMTQHSNSHRIKTIDKIQLSQRSHRAVLRNIRLQRRTLEIRQEQQFLQQVGRSVVKIYRAFGKILQLLQVVIGHSFRVVLLGPLFKHLLPHGIVVGLAESDRGTNYPDDEKQNAPTCHNIQNL